jgi:hypothetical protein
MRVRTYSAIVRIGAKMAQYCARRAPLPIVPLVDGETIHQLQYEKEKGVTYDIKSKDPSGGRSLQSKGDVGRSTIVPWYMVVPWVVLRI